MNKINASKLVQYWKTASDLDFKSATEIANQTKQYVQALFFLHLSLEKILKSFVVYTTQNHAPYSHNLSFLADKTKIVFSKKQLSLLLEVNSFNLECRYPDAQFKIYKKATKGTVSKLLKEGGELREWILEQLRKN